MSETAVHKNYSFALPHDLIIAIHYSTATPIHKIVKFFAQKIEDMIAAEPNIKMAKPTYKSGFKSERLRNRVWVMKGYYPHSGVAFKIKIIAPPIEENSDYYSIAIDRPTSKDVMVVTSQEIVKDYADYDLLGGDVVLTLSKCRIMTPKGAGRCRLLMTRNKLYGKK